MTYLRIAVYYYSRMLRKNVDIHHNSPRILIVHYLRNQWTTMNGNLQMRQFLFCIMMQGMLYELAHRNH